MIWKSSTSSDNALRTCLVDGYETDTSEATDEPREETQWSKCQRWERSALSVREEVLVECDRVLAGVAVDSPPNRFSTSHPSRAKISFPSAKI